jgi:hypothetical protein
MLLASGCGQRVVDGEFLGDATLRLTGFMAARVRPPPRPLVGALWLGYDGLSQPLSGVETTVLPITSFDLSGFTCDVLGAPPSAGQYLTADGSLIPASIRLARLFVFEDVDANGTFAVDGSGQLAAPDILLAVAASTALLFVEKPPPEPHALDAAHLFLGNWEAADFGYHLLQLDGPDATPDVAAHVIDARTQVAFTTPSLPVIW